MATEEIIEGWELGGGLPLDGAEVTITDFAFGPNNDIAPGAIFANIVFTDGEGEVHEQSYSVGQGWEAREKGAEIQPEDGRKRRLAKRSNFGIFVENLIAAVRRSGTNPADVLGRGFQFADSFTGLQLQMGSVEVVNTNRDTGEETRRDRIVPVLYLGSEASSGKAEAAATPAPQEAAASGDPLIDSLIELAQRHGDHDSFMDEALEAEGVTGNRDLEKKVMTTGKGSIWALAGKG